MLYPFSKKQKKIIDISVVHVQIRNHVVLCGGDTLVIIICSGGSLLHHGASYPFSPLLQGGRHPAPASFSPYPPQLLYWPYPSPPMSPNNYFLPSHPTTLLTPTSSISSLSNGVTSPPPTLQGSPVPLSGQPPANSLVMNSYIPMCK